MATFITLSMPASDGRTIVPVPPETEEFFRGFNDEPDDWHLTWLWDAIGWAISQVPEFAEATGIRDFHDVPVGSVRVDDRTFRIGDVTAVVSG